MTPTRLLNEFASTFREWHYLAGGFCIGWSLGLWAGTKLANNS